MKLYDVEFWMYSGSKDDYDNHSEKIKAISKKHANKIVKDRYPRAKNIVSKLITKQG